MQSKNKRAATAAEKQHIAQVAQLPCSVCNADGPSEVHEPKQGKWWISIALCPACHRGTHGWHGDRMLWRNAKMYEELDALQVTLARLHGGKA